MKMVYSSRGPVSYDANTAIFHCQLNVFAPYIFNSAVIKRSWEIQIKVSSQQAESF